MASPSSATSPDPSTTYDHQPAPETGPDEKPPRKVTLALLALTLGGFGIGLTEFVIAGLLPEVAASFAVSEARAGALISGYALSVAVGAVFLTAATTRLNRRTVLVGLMVLFVVGNLLNAVADTYTMMMVGRVVAALCHGAFFGIGSVTAAALVRPERRAAAVATMFAGLTTANVLGVPFGTFVGHTFGWRTTFGVITVIGVVALLGVASLLPSAPGTPGSGLRAELSAFRRQQIWVSIVITTLGFGGMFGAFTYVAYTVTGVSGFAQSDVSWLLVVFGAGLFVGNYVGAKAADRMLDTTIAAALAALTATMVVFAITATSQSLTIMSLFLMGLFGFAIVPGVQMRVMHHAPAAPTLASGANIAAFNIGNALGAWLGGLAITAGLGYTSPVWIGAGLVAGALAVLTIGAAKKMRPVT